MTKRKDGTWQQQMTVIENGRKKQRYFYGKTKQEVLRKIAAYKNKTDAGATFDEIADEWWDIKEPTFAPKTATGYRPHYTRAVERFRNIPVTAIAPSDVNRFIMDFVREYHPAQKTAASQLQIVRNILQYAVQNGYAETNAAREITIPNGLSKKDREPPSAENIAHIKASVCCTFGLFAYMAIYTGLRRGELLALAWDDIDIDNRVIRITKSICYPTNSPVLKKPKTQRGTRSVPILDKLLDVLQPSNGLVFPAGDGGYLHQSGFDRRWALYCKEACVSCTPHQLRHAYATMLFENGIEVKDAQRLLGHAQASTTQDIYTHIRAQREQSINAQLYHVDIS